MTLTLEKQNNESLSSSKYINIVHGNSEGWITRAEISNHNNKQMNYNYLQL